MTPEYIIRKSLCRPAFCSDADVETRARRIEDIQYSHEYAEPGYTQPKRGILFGNWNYFAGGLDTILERAGYQMEWEDEWSTCSDCGKAFRTSPDSYSWQPSYFLINDCELLCRDCVNMEEYLETLEDNPRKALNDHVDPAEFGYRKLAGDFESGLHTHMTDNPKTIYAELHAAGHKRLLFNIDASSQFYTTFSIWEKIQEVD